MGLSSEPRPGAGGRAPAPRPSRPQQEPLHFVLLVSLLCTNVYGSMFISCFSNQIRLSVAGGGDYGSQRPPQLRSPSPSPSQGWRPEFLRGLSCSLAAARRPAGAVTPRSTHAGPHRSASRHSLTQPAVSWGLRCGVLHVLYVSSTHSGAESPTGFTHSGPAPAVSPFGSRGRGVPSTVPPCCVLHSLLSTGLPNGPWQVRGRQATGLVLGGASAPPRIRPACQYGGQLGPGPWRGGQASGLGLCENATEVRPARGWAA